MICDEHNIMYNKKSYFSIYIDFMDFLHVVSHAMIYHFISLFHAPACLHPKIITKMARNYVISFGSL